MRNTIGRVNVAGVESEGLVAFFVQLNVRFRECGLETDAPALAEVVLDVDGEAGAGLGGNSHRDGLGRKGGDQADLALDEIAEDERAGVDADAPVLSGERDGDGE
jgi:hypothetical protein